MGEVLTRKCACCKGVIEIERNSITNVISHKGKYYHKNCFVEMAQRKAASKSGKPKMWQDALDDIWTLEADTKSALEKFFDKDELNTWLLDNYDISLVPSYFWQMVTDLEGGKYKNKRCKPIGTKTLCACWKWGQRNLNQISANNKMRGTGPTNDSQRLLYDLAIIIGKVPNYLSEAAKNAIIETNASHEQKQNKINYTVISKTANENKETDILDLLDEIF